MIYVKEDNKINVYQKTEEVFAQDRTLISRTSVDNKNAQEHESDEQSLLNQDLESAGKDIKTVVNEQEFQPSQQKTNKSNWSQSSNANMLGQDQIVSKYSKQQSNESLHRIQKIGDYQAQDAMGKLNKGNINSRQKKLRTEAEFDTNHLPS